MENKNEPFQAVLLQQVGEESYRAVRPNDDKTYQKQFIGLTKREYVATQILAGLSANRWSMELGNYSDKQLAEMAVERTDLLFEALSKP